MRFGINTFLFTSPFTNQSVRLFPKFKSWGFEAVEIAIENLSDIDPAFVRAALGRNGLACSSICACVGPGRDLRGTKEEQKTALDYLRGIIDQAVALGCPKIIGPVYSVVGRAEAYPDVERRRHWKSVVGNLKKLGAYAEKRGIQIAIEPLNRFETDFLNTCDQAIRLIQDVGSPACTILLDTFHMNIEEKSQAAAIRRAGRLLGHFHACGCDRGTPGNDHIDWKSIAKALKSIRYDGDVVIESFTTDVKAIARAAAIWRQIEPKRDDIAVKGRRFLARTLR